MNKTVLERFERILGHRKAHPWGASVGWNRGVIDRLRKGVIPGHEFLAALARAENVDLNWLLTGAGRPFRVAVTRNDAEASVLIGAHLQDSADWRVYLFRAGARLAVVMAMAAEYTLKDKAYPYTAVELVVGELGPRTIALLRDLDLQGRLTAANTSPEMLAAIEAGEVGTWELMADDGPVKRADRERLVWGSKEVAEAPEPYKTREGLITFSELERSLVDRLLRLDEEDQRAVDALLASFERRRE